MTKDENLNIDLFSAKEIDDLIILTGNGPAPGREAGRHADCSQEASELFHKRSSGLPRF